MFSFRGEFLDLMLDCKESTLMINRWTGDHYDAEALKVKIARRSGAPTQDTRRLCASASHLDLGHEAGIKKSLGYVFVAFAVIGCHLSIREGGRKLV